jgi:hypothetical protein
VIVIVLVALAAGVVFIPNICGLLACDSPVKAQILVVEGWIPDYVIPGAITGFDMNSYKIMIAGAGPLQLGSHLLQFKTYTRLTQARLMSLGFNDNEIIVLRTRNMKNTGRTNGLDLLEGEKELTLSKRSKQHDRWSIFVVQKFSTLWKNNPWSRERSLVVYTSLVLTCCLCH